MASYETLYPGVDYTTISPAYFVEPISYKSNISSLGMSLDPRTANQLGLVNTALNPGVRNIEVQGITPGAWESVPEQHLDEMRRLMKLTGAKASLHGPLVEASGVGEKGWTEENRLGAEKQLQSAIERGHKLDPKGNISVTVHSTAQLPDFKPKIVVDHKEGKPVFEEQGTWIVNEDTGQFQFLRPEKKFLPREGESFTGKEIKYNIDNELKTINEEQWTEQLSRINYYADIGQNSLEALEKSFPKEIIKELGKVDTEHIKEGEEKKYFERAQRAMTHGQIYLRDSYRMMRSLFDKAYSNANEEDKKTLKEFAGRVSSDLPGIEKDPEKLERLKEIVEDGLKKLSKIKTPEIWKPLDNFVVNQTAKTFANVAKSAYDKFGSTAPIINVENPPAGSGLSTAEDLKRVVETSRKQFADMLVDKKGMSKSEASKVAEKMIGATWDVGHINMLRKKGYSEKDIIDQSKTIAPFVKHVHLSDNFGLDHTELPMGMGNVPIKPILENLKKAGFKGEQIIEAGNWWQYFSEHGGGNPFLPSIEAFNSPIYGAVSGPGWGSIASRYGSYYMGHGPINPPIHHNVYGAGFQTLPVELGGEIPGDRGRFAGTPNQ